MIYNELIEKQVIGRLRVDNPWWTENEIAKYYSQMRPVYTLISSILWCVIPR